MRTVVLVQIVAGLFAHAVLAQSTNLSVRSISLEECVKLSLQHNLDLQIERFTPQIARYNLNSSYGIYDPVFTFKAGREYLQMPGQIDPKKTGTDAPYNTQDDLYSPGISGRLPTGLSYGLSANADVFHATTYFPAFTRYTNEYLASVGMTLKQPLLKDFWIDASRLKIQVDKKNLKISELALQQQIMNTVTKVRLSFYEWVFACELVKVQEKAREQAQQLLADNRKRLEAGKLRPLEEKQTEAQVATVEADLVAAQQVKSDQQNTLKHLILDDYKSWSDLLLEPAEVLVAVQVPFNRQESWQKAVALRPDFQQFKLDMEKNDLMVQFRFNQLFPSLDLVGSYGGRAVQSGFGAALSDMGDGSNPAYSYGVVLSIPLSRRAERNNYKASEAAKKQALLQLKKLEQDILVQVENAGNLTQSTYKRVNSTRQARLFAETALEAEQKRLEAGMSTSFIVLQMQRNLTDARSAEIRALTDYQKALVQLDFSEGSVLEKNHLVVEAR